MWRAGSAVHDAALSFLDGAIDTVNAALALVLQVGALVNSVIELSRQAQQALDVAQFQRGLGDVNATASRISATLGDKLSLAHRILNAFALAVTLLAAGYIAIGLFNVLLMRTHRRNLLLAGSLLVWLVVAAAWAVAGATYVLFVVGSDACLVVSAVTDDPASSGLSSLAPCLQPTFAASISSVALQPALAGVLSMNERLARCNAGTGLVCIPAVMDASSSLLVENWAACDASNISIIHAAKPGPDAVSATFAAAFNQRACPQIAAVLPQVGRLFDATSELFSAEQQAQPLLNCSFVRSLVDSARFTCVELQHALQLLFAGSLLAALGLTLLQPLLLAGVRRACAGVRRLFPYDQQ